MNKAPLVSVIVHTKNSQRTIAQHLQSVKEQTYKNIEIIMVDNNSTDNTVFTAKRFTNGRSFHKNNIFNYGPERSAQRNFGAKKAHGDYYFVPDCDMTFDKKVIEECIDLVIKKPSLKAIIVPERSVGKGFWSACKMLERSCYLGDSTIEAARFFEKKTFWEMGGYDEELTGPEDWDLPQKIRSKYEVGRIKSFIFHDEGNISLLSLAKKKYYYGLHVSRYIRKHPVSSTAQQIIYLLRPAFYKNRNLLFKRPILTAGMIVMLSVEQLAGFTGFLVGSIRR